MDIASMTKEELQAELKNRNIKVHHKTGIDKLRSTLQESVDGADHDPAVTVPAVELSKPVKVKTAPMTAHEAKIARMSPKEQAALRLIRIVVSPNDPLMSSYPGLIFTVGSSKINKGKMIKKYVPFNNEEGWHVPYMIYEQILHAEMQKFKQVKRPNGEKDLEPYITRKFNVTILPELTIPQMEKLAAIQKSRGDT